MRTVPAVIFLGLFTVAASAQTPQVLTVTSPTLKAGETIPRDYTADGRNVSPPLQWSGAPASTKEFAVICDDPDVPMPQPFVHWLIYKIPGTAKGLPENIPIDPATPMLPEIAGAVQGISGFKRPIYRGPAPPPGKPHHYHFKVYAIDAVLDLKPGLTKAELLEAIKGHIVGEGELVAIYERTPQPQMAIQPQMARIQPQMTQMHR
jgi:Raf kinase inhibitor-like YbhB/YbcL family protein